MTKRHRNNGIHMLLNMDTLRAIIPAHRMPSRAAVEARGAWAPRRWRARTRVRACMTEALPWVAGSPLIRKSLFVVSGHCQYASAFHGHTDATYHAQSKPLCALIPDGYGFHHCVLQARQEGKLSANCCRTVTVTLYTFRSELSSQ